VRRGCWRIQLAIEVKNSGRKKPTEISGLFVVGARERRQMSSASHDGSSRETSSNLYGTVGVRAHLIKKYSSSKETSCICMLPAEEALICPQSETSVVFQILILQPPVTRCHRPAG